MRPLILRTLALALSLSLLAACGDDPAVDAAPVGAEPASYEVEALSLGSIKNVHTCSGVLLAGQPAEDDFALLKERGIELVLDTRTEGEVAFDEPALVEAAGMEYLRVGFRKPEELTDEKIDTIRAALRDAEEKPLILHCGSANRVGAVWLAWRVLDAGGVTFDEALVDAKEIGLKTDALAERVREYVEARQGGGE